MTQMKKYADFDKKKLEGKKKTKVLMDTVTKEETAIIDRKIKKQYLPKFR
jgi:hypothetical protein